MMIIPMRYDQQIILDDADWERAKNLSWFIYQDKKNGNWYASHNMGRKYNWKHIQLHAFVTGAYGQQHDHINHNGLDCRRENIRVCDHHQNQGNRRLNRNNTSGYKGVYPVRGQWCAVIQADGKRKHLGLYDTAIEAARAYDEAATEYFGQFACTNAMLGTLSASTFGK